MPLDGALGEALARLVRKPTSGSVLVAKLTTRQWERGGTLACKVSQSTFTNGFLITTRSGQSTVRYFMVGKDTLADNAGWVLG